jgi:hypothetical protein
MISPSALFFRHENSPRRHGEHGDKKEKNSRSFLLRDLRVSVVNSLFAVEDRAEHPSRFRAIAFALESYSQPTSVTRYTADHCHQRQEHRQRDQRHDEAEEEHHAGDDRGVQQHHRSAELCRVITG